MAASPLETNNNAGETGEHRECSRRFRGRADGNYVVAAQRHCGALGQQPSIYSSGGAQPDRGRGQNVPLENGRSSESRRTADLPKHVARLSAVRTI